LVDSVSERHPLAVLAADFFVVVELETGLAGIIVADITENVGGELALGVVALTGWMKANHLTQAVLPHDLAHRLHHLGARLASQVPEPDVEAEDPLYLLERHVEGRREDPRDLLRFALAEKVRMYVYRGFVQAASEESALTVEDVATLCRDLGHELLLVARLLDEVIVQCYLQVNEAAHEQQSTPL
jgi:hypothetical protein